MGRKYIPRLRPYVRGLTEHGLMERAGEEVMAMARRGLLQKVAPGTWEIGPEAERIWRGLIRQPWMEICTPPA